LRLRAQCYHPHSTARYVRTHRHRGGLASVHAGFPGGARFSSPVKLIDLLLIVEPGDYDRPSQLQLIALDFARFAAHPR
jgi:hypothetical protein